MKQLDLKIISAEKSLYEGKVGYVKLPGSEGDFSVHPDHAPLISSLKSGDIEYSGENGESKTIVINSGFVEVLKNVVTICVE